MKTFKTSSLEQFLTEFGRFCNSGDCYFRGQPNAIWNITPSLARNKTDETIYNKIEDIEKIEEKLLTKFKEKVSDNDLENIMSIIPNSYHESWQWMMGGQHYGLPTRLLDFSLDKYTALQFAVAELQYLNNDGVFIVYSNPNFIQEDVESPVLRGPFKPINKSFFIQSISNLKKDNNEYRLSERRKFVQGSKFLYRETSKLRECLSLDNNHSHKLTKIDIPKELKLSLIEYLIDEKQFAFDIYAGENVIDYYAAILKNEFMNLSKEKIDEF